MSRIIPIIMEQTMSENGARAFLEKLILEHGDDYASLSKLVGRNAAYIQQFIKRGSPRALPERERGILARYFGVDEKLLGAPKSNAAGKSLKMIPQLSVQASAGAGSLDAEESLADKMGFSPIWLKKLAVDPNQLSLINVRGDSMSPTLDDGDDIMVEGGAAASNLRDGIFVIRTDDTLMVKRLAIGPGGQISILSDNPAWPDWENVKAADISVIGRVVWVGRKL